MPVRIVRLGSPRGNGEGLRLGTVRRPPRGVRKADYGRLDFFDVWLPNLAPSAALIRAFRPSGVSGTRDWHRFERRYRSEMRRPDAARLLDALAALSHQTNFSVGCYCEDERRCHRSLLRELLKRHGAKMA